jgi:transcriptional regulator with XRE-family HTH domain
VLAEARAAAGLTQAQLAERLGVSQVTILDWEKGKRPVPRERVPALAAALGIDPWVIDVYLQRIPEDLRERKPEDIVRALRGI